MTRIVSRINRKVPVEPGVLELMLSCGKKQLSSPVICFGTNNLNPM